MDARSLTEIANDHGSDKGTLGPSDDWLAHNYTDIYEAYLEQYRHDPINLLEIGVGAIGTRWESRIVHGRNRLGGASLRMWYDYLPGARIYGIDINPASHLNNERVRTFVADQGNVEELRHVMEAIGDVRFDVIIDDGSHRPDHQQIALGFLFPHLRSGGLYFIEDLMTNGFGDGARGRFACEAVRNTRAILKSFRETGRFPQPHALSDPEGLAVNIASISFHAPWEVPAKRGLAAFLTILHGETVGRRYASGSERLCVIRRR